MVSELRRSTSLELVFSRFYAPAGESSADALFQDITNDWREFDFLLNDLIARAAQVSAPIAQTLADLQVLFNRRLAMLEAPKVSPAILRAMRNEFLAAKNQLRACYRKLAAEACLGDWQSPIYSVTDGDASNRLMTGIAEHKFDYKRDGHLEAADYEKKFIQEYASHIGGTGWKAYLTNSGMAAFSTTLHWLLHEQRLGDTVLAIEPMYFENIHLAGRMASNVVRVNRAHGADLMRHLRLNDPSLVLVDVVTNCNDVIAHDIETILQWARTERRERAAIVIDTTCMPTALLPDGMFEGIPDHINVVLIESLAKHHQFGMDAVTGGIAVMKATAGQHTDFSKTRARFGGNITDVGALTLPTPNREALVARMKRHSRNVALLIEKLQDNIESHSGIIDSFSWFSESDFHASTFTIHLHEELRSIDKYQKFEQQVLSLAKQRGLPLALSTSFGFDVTRLYVTAPSTVFEPPFLRVAIGTETSEEIETLAEIIASTHRQLALVWKPQPKPARNTQIRTSERFDARTNEMLSHRVYTGEQGVADYLNPKNFGNTPLVELPTDLNPFAADGVRIFAKVMPLVPLMNIKSVPAFSMMQAAAQRGELANVHTVLESSSGNTVLSLSVIARLFGINDTRAIVDHSIAPALVRTLRLFGIDIMKHPGPGHELYSQVAPRSDRARNLGAQPGWLNPGQYSNPDNPDGFAKWLAPQLWSQTLGEIDVLSCALGTCGTIYGVAKELKQRKADIKVLGCCPRAGQAVPGPREASQLVDVAFPWQSVVDEQYEMEAAESFAASVKLLRRGIMGGPSSGMNYVGLLRHLSAEREAGRLTGESKVAVFMCCDSPFAHVDEYFDALGDEHFGIVHEYEVGQA